MDWEIPSTSVKLIIETNDRRGVHELKGRLSSKEIMWFDEALGQSHISILKSHDKFFISRYLYLINDGYGYIRLTMECLTPTECCFPTLYYDLKFGGTIKRPYVHRKGKKLTFYCTIRRHQKFSLYI